MNIIHGARRVIIGPTPQEQKDAINKEIRKNSRQIDSELRSIGQTETKTKTMVRQCVKRNDIKSAKLLAIELYKSKKHRDRLTTSKAQLNSLKLQVDNMFRMRKIEGTMKSSTTVMKEVNSLIKLPELMATMGQLSNELMKAGVIEEMVDDTLEVLDASAIEEDEEAEMQANTILAEITGGKLGNAGTVPQNVPAQTEPSAPVEEDEEEEDEVSDEVLSAMRERLKALQS